MAEFKWKDRRRATEVAIDIKNEKGVSAEDAVKEVLKEFEGEYFVSGDAISDKRFENFVQRVEEEKRYKGKRKSNTTPETALKQLKIAELLEKGNITKLQATVLDGVFNMLENYAPGTSDLTLKSLATHLGMKEPRVKGTLGHLIKKGYIVINETEADGVKYNIIFINVEKYDLYNDTVATD